MSKITDPEQVQALIERADQAERAFNAADEAYDAALVTALSAMAGKVESVVWDVECEYGGRDRVFERPTSVTLLLPGDSEDLYLGEEYALCDVHENMALLHSLGRLDGNDRDESEVDEVYVPRRVSELTGIAPDNLGTFMSLLGDYLWRNKWERRLDFEEETAPEAAQEAELKA